MRKSVSFLAVSLLFGTMACEFSTEDNNPDGGSGEGRGNGEVGDRGTPVNPASADGGGIADAGRGDAASPTGNGDGAVADAGAPAAPVTPATADATGQPGEQCSAPLITASTACAAPDVFEPNDESATAIAIPSGDGCAVVPGKLSSDSDDDWYRFTTVRRDPVLVELGYETTPSGGANLTATVQDPMDRVIANAGGNRKELVEVASDAFVSNKGFAYDVRIHDPNLKSCQGYNLRVNPNFCTDPLEDNDSADKAGPGLTYGTKLDAVVFYEDADYYDLSALQTNGASCSFSADVKLSSPETITFAFARPTGSVILNSYLKGTKASEVVTLEAGSGASVLHVFSDERVCTSYSVTCTPL